LLKAKELNPTQITPKLSKAHQICCYTTVNQIGPSFLDTPQGTDRGTRSAPTVHLLYIYTSSEAATPESDTTAPETTPPPPPSLLHPPIRRARPAPPRPTSPRSRLAYLLPSFSSRPLPPPGGRVPPACERTAAGRRRPGRHHGQVRAGARHRVGQLRGGAADAQPGDPRARSRQAHRARPPGLVLAPLLVSAKGFGFGFGSAGVRRYSLELVPALC
jgi:hypothetical protein